MTALSDAVDDLTLPKPVKVVTDDGFTWGTEDPLLVQLEEAIHSTMGRTGGRGGGNSRSILDDDALMRFSQISSVIVDWCRMAGAVVIRTDVPDSAVNNLRAWHDAFETTNGEGLDTFYVAQLWKWADLIRAKLTPRETLEFTDPCPECLESDWVNDEGSLIPNPVSIEYVKTDVLNSVRGSCRACGKVWQGTWELRWLRFSADEISKKVVDSAPIDV